MKIIILFCIGNKSILEESEIISDNTKIIADIAERNAMISISAKGRSSDLRRSELNLVEELRKYRRSNEVHTTKKAAPPRKTKSF